MRMADDEKTEIEETPEVEAEAPAEEPVEETPESEAQAETPEPGSSETNQVPEVDAAPDVTDAPAEAPAAEAEAPAEVTDAPAEEPAAEAEAAPAAPVKKQRSLKHVPRSARRTRTKVKREPAAKRKSITR